MILCDHDLEFLLQDGLLAWPGKTLDNRYDLVNPASIDIRVGWDILLETEVGFKEMRLPTEGLTFPPGQFALVPTFESIFVPNGYGVDLRLKSTRAREGWDHSLAFWIDPGYRGVATMEIRNGLQYGSLKLVPEQRFAQILVHKLSGKSDKPYDGQYGNTNRVQRARL